jgi:hypothetical protein
MKNSNTKLVFGLGFLTAGLILVSIGIRWLFFVGLAFVVLSGVLSFRQRTRSGSVIAWLFCIGAIVFLVLFSSYGVERPPLAALVAVWLSGIAEELHGWRLMRRTT